MFSRFQLAFRLDRQKELDHIRFWHHAMKMLQFHVPFPNSNCLKSISLLVCAAMRKMQYRFPHPFIAIHLLCNCKGVGSMNHFPFILLYCFCLWLWKEASNFINQWNNTASIIRHFLPLTHYLSSKCVLLEHNINKNFYYKSMTTCEQQDVYFSTINNTNNFNRCFNGISILFGRMESVRSKN
jgi:hypothetical protein